MNNDLISREALIKWIDDSVSQYGNTYSTDMLNMWGLFKDYLINFAPTVDIPNYGGQVMPDTLQGWRYEERPQGEWIIDIGEMVICPFCKERHCCKMNFCGNCGADMRGKEE